jgi:hypothetical protein
MDDVGLLVKALIRERPQELLIENYKCLEFANSVLANADEDHQIKALEAVMEYTVQQGHVPDSIASVLHFIQGNRKHIAKFDKSLEYDQQLAAIAEDDDDRQLSAAMLIDSIYHKAFDMRLSGIYATASNIATGGMKNPHTKETGPSAADEYIQTERQKLYIKGAHEVGGDLMDNLDYLEEFVNSYIVGDSRRVQTGLKKIDDICLIGRKQRLRWIGILGYTHHGKSLLLATMLYNMVANGATVMLCPRESSVEEAWMGFVWLHHKKICPDKPLASRAAWMRGEVTTEEYNTIQFIMDDLRNGDSLPGKIVVFACRSWEDIEEKLRLTNKKYKYDVLAIDYFAHLDMEGGSKQDSDRDKYNKALRKAQLLSMNGVDNDQSGLVVITPLQANRKGYEEASKQEGDKYGIYENANAVEFFTQAAQDMDLLMSVWFEGDMCKEVSPKQMLVHCLKGRGDMKFPTHRLEIHPETGMVSDIGLSEAKVDRDRTVNSLPDVDIDALLHTTTTRVIDTENWGT